MRLHWLGMLLLGSLALLLLTSGLADAQETKGTETKKPWTGKLADGQEITQADLDRILQAHALWIESKGKEGQRANLSEAILSYANLSGARRNLSGGRFFVPEVNLSGADLLGANLTGAMLLKTNLSGALLFDANLSEAILSYANLSGADLSHANLSGADLREVNLSGAWLFGGNLSGAVFEPKHGTVSDVSFLLDIKGLASLQYIFSSHGLVELRETYKKAGLRDQERQVTYALNHTRREKLWDEGGFPKLESLFNQICFEWTCQYGMNPGRPLELLGLGLFLFTPLYLLALRSRHPETGIWLLLPPDRIIGGGSKVRPFKLTGHTPFRPLPLRRWPRLKARLRRGLRQVRLAFYFSLLSAFNLGWRELNVGNWISRIQKNEYTLQATGWPRTVAGLQSLLSVYMLALWVLTYFGRPFD